MSNSFQKLFNMFSLIIIEILFSPFIYLCDAFTSLAISFVKRKPKTKKKPPPQSPFVKGTECGVPAIPFVKGCKLLCRGLLSCPHCVVLNLYIYIFFWVGLYTTKNIPYRCVTFDRKQTPSETVGRNLLSKFLPASTLVPFVKAPGPHSAGKSPWCMFFCL